MPKPLTVLVCVAVGLFLAAILVKIHTKYDIIDNGEKIEPEISSQPSYNTAYSVYSDGLSASRVSDDEWNRRFWFVPNNLVGCLELFGGNGNLPDKISQKLQEHISFVTNISHHMEGYTAKYPLAYKAYLEMASHKSIKTICETGFNAGHSSLGWLLSNADAHVYAFDIGRHKYSRPIAARLQDQVPGRLDVTWGDSTKTLPQFRGENPEVKCDLIIIDGGHTPEICQADFDNFRAMATGDNLLILDNYPQLAGNYRLGEVWEPAKRTLKLAEIMRCMYGDNKKFGFTVGRYLLP